MELVVAIAWQLAPIADRWCSHLRASRPIVHRAHDSVRPPYVVKWHLAPNASGVRGHLLSMATPLAATSRHRVDALDRRAVRASSIRIVSLQTLRVARVLARVT